MYFTLTAKQQEANSVLAGSSKHILFYGGSRSGKTFLMVRGIIIRALKAAGSRHAILRFRGNAVRQSVMMDTFPKVMSLCFPGTEYNTNQSLMFASFSNGSEVWFGGLDDKERVEKILGNEYVTLYFNECSQIPYSSRNMALTRLAQKCHQTVNGISQVLPLKVYYDENPPDKGHWSYRLFRQKLDPETRAVLPDADNYISMQLNPGDNQDNLPEDYVRQLASMSPRMQKRFLLGEFKDANANALFSDQQIDKWRKTDGELPDMVRIVVAVDPSGSGDEDNAENDAIGLVVAGLGTDGVGYLLEDLTLKAGPKTWGALACNAYERYGADVIVGEINYGGDMVRFVLKAANPKINFKKITSSRGKVVRAEPISPLVEDGRIRFAGYFPELEEELAGFTTNGYTGENSPNRADAFVFAFAELFPGIITPRREVQKVRASGRYNTGGTGAWMA